MRIYGARRLRMLFGAGGFEELRWFGHDKTVLERAPLWEWSNQPLIVLHKKL